VSILLPPRFIQSFEHLEQVDRHHKLYHCPHCHCVGTLIKHGWLRGFGPHGSIKGIRARRLFCSNRGTRPGCGRSISVFFANVLCGLSLTSCLLWRFLAACTTGNPGASIKAAWQSLPSAISRSLTTGYRIYHRLRLTMPMLRTALARLHPPPTGVLSDDPMAALVAHLDHLPAPADDPIAHFQQLGQRHFFAP